MNVRELMFIKKTQREFRSIFGKDLIVDFPTMNEEEKDLVPAQELENYRNSLLNKYGLSKEDIRGNMRNTKRSELSEKVKHFMTEYSKYVLKNKFDQNIAGELIGKHRTSLYHYAKGEYI